MHPVKGNYKVIVQLLTRNNRNQKQQNEIFKSAGGKSKNEFNKSTKNSINEDKIDTFQINRENSLLADLSYKKCIYHTK